jgi:hypothetical protein
MLLARALRVIALGAVLLGAMAATAYASDYCVNRTGCTVGNTYTDSGDGVQLNAAITAASGTPSNRVLIGAGTYSNNFYFSGTNGLSVIGAGQGKTILQDGGGTFTPVLSITGNGSTVSDMTINVTNGTGWRGLQIGGAGSSATRITVTEAAAAQNTIGILDHTGATVSAATITLPLSSSEGVSMSSGSGTLTDSTIQAGAPSGGGTGVAFSGPSIPFTFTRDRIAAGTVITGDGGIAEVDDSVLLPVGPGAIGLQAANFNSPGTNSVKTINAKRDTIVGDGSSNQIATYSYGGQFSGGGSNNSTINLDSTVINAVTHPLYRTVAFAGSTADITATYVNHDPTGDVSSGSGGSTTQSHALNVPPGFVNAAGGDYHLLYNSALVDTGNPAALPPGTTDLEGNPRPVNGSGVGPIVDIGAYEYQRPAPTVSAMAGVPTANTAQTVSFTANASVSDPGDPVAVTWSFDDGATASGSSVTHAFSTPGAHTATATATAGNGLAASQGVTVTVSAPGGGGGGGGGGAKVFQPAFTTTGAAATKAQATSIVVDPGITATCPVGAGSCTVVETLTATVPASAAKAKPRSRKVMIGRAQFTIGAGRIGRLQLKLNRKGKQLLRKLHRLTVQVAVAGHDGTGPTVTISRRITIKTPKPPVRRGKHA